MRCAWDELIRIVPNRFCLEVDRLGRDDLQELRLRVGTRPELVRVCGSSWLQDAANGDDIAYVINSASQYSPWAAETAAKGYITAPGGHRVGIAGICTLRAGALIGIRQPRSVCIRVARDIPGIGTGLPMEGSVLILGPPGSGKTTLLRELIRQRSAKMTVGVVDERCELFPPEADFPCGARTDILSGCSKKDGLQMLLRTMGPSVIATDEITGEEDCEGLVHAAWCGVQLLATAHAADLSDFEMRPVYRPLLRCGLFDTFVIMGRNKSWRMERMSKWN